MDVREKAIPRIGIGVFVEKEGKVLLGKRKNTHGALMWAPPGGHLEFGESVEECAKRELLEETGLEALSCALGPWVENVMDDGKKHYISIFIFVDQFKGEPQLLEPEKCEGWHWFAWEELPQPLIESVASFIQNYRKQLQKL